MKIIFKKIIKDGSGSIKIECEEPEDFWHIYNLIRVGDIITSSTLRKISHSTSTGTIQNQKKKINLSIKIDTIEYDTHTCHIRVKGTNCRENKYVSLGQSHTIELALHRAFTIEKLRWDHMDLQRISMACDPTKHADVAVIVMEQGLAHLMLVTSHMTLDRCKISKTIPKKRIGSATRHDKAILRFYELILEAITRHIDFNIIKCIVLASPAFIKDDAYDFIFSECNKRANASDSSNYTYNASESGLNNENNKFDGENIYKVILYNKSKFIKGHCSSGHRGAVKEVLGNVDMQKKLGNTKAAEQVLMLDEFFKMLNQDETRAIYGIKYVLAANEANAIDKLLVTDSLFRARDVKLRKQYVDLVEACEKNGAQVFVFSSLHVSGEQLNQITGIAALLRFPMPDLLEMEDTEDENENDENEDESENENEDDESERKIDTINENENENENESDNIKNNRKNNNIMNDIDADLGNMGLSSEYQVSTNTNTNTNTNRNININTKEVDETNGNYSNKNDNDNDHFDGEAFM